jgi:hypothetical protein
VEAVEQGDHLGEKLGGQARVERGGDRKEVVGLQQVDVDPGEAVEEGLGQALAAAALLEGVLGRKQPELRVAVKRLPQLGDEDLGPVVQQGVEALEDGLR